MEYKVVENKEEGLEQIKHLVKKFNDDEEYYTSKDYQEEPTKFEFINHFFESLGWDVTNTNEEPPYARDVTTEESINTKEGKKKPDYSFRIDGSNIFFVEAKPPNIQISEDNHPSFQLRRYAWSAKLDVSILTDFEEFSVYTTKVPPKETDYPSIDRPIYWDYKKYIKNWDKLWDLFSKEAVTNGSLERFSKKHTKSTITVDKQFLNEIDSWRKILAKNIYHNNDINISELNESVQSIIDRIIFIRMAEDRNIQTDQILEELLDKDNVYESFIDLCGKYDDKFNSGLFHFQNEEYIDQDPDILTPSLKIDNDILTRIIENLYYPKSPYEFSAISPEILGKVYEEFLGKKINIKKEAKNDEEHVEIDFKPEIPKEQGVYYTPSYIVDYIVENTVGKILKNKNPTSAKKIKIVDPACGSGSFLIGAYEYLLNWYTYEYSKWKKFDPDIMYKNSKGETKLTIKEKKRILQDNIFGVDIDSEAVEVTKLSLMLKVLEDEKKDSLEKQLTIFKERALPNLEKNIQCGNSLVDTDDLIKQDYESTELINPFDWEKEFSDIFTNNDENENGFDVVLGNPPYIYESTYRTAFDGLRKSKYYIKNINIWHFFGLKSLDLVKKGGLVSFIAESSWMNNDGAKSFRKKVSEVAKINSFIDFKEYKIFKKDDKKTVGVNTMIYVMEKDENNEQYTTDYSELRVKKFSIHDLKMFLKLDEEIETPEYKKFKSTIKKENIEDGLTFTNDKIQRITENIYKEGNFNLTKNELESGMDLLSSFSKRNLSLINKPELVGSGIFVISQAEKDSLNLNKKELEITKPFYTTKEISRYYTTEKNEKWVIYTTDEINKKIQKQINSENKDYPNIQKHLDKYHKLIEKKSERAPYGINRPRREKVFLGEKILSRRMCTKRPCFSYVDFDSFFSRTFISIRTEQFNLKALTGILNSNLIFFWLKNKGKYKGKNLQIDMKPLKKIPIKIPDRNTMKRIEKKVDELNQLNKKEQKLRSKNEKRKTTQNIELQEKILNKMVYDLYNISEKDRDFIEKNIKT